MVRMGYKPWFNNLFWLTVCVLAHRTKHRADRVWSRSRAQAVEEHRRARRHAQRACGS